jgi:hypothetical protein
VLVTERIKLTGKKIGQPFIRMLPTVSENLSRDYCYIAGVIVTRITLVACE